MAQGRVAVFDAHLHVIDPRFPLVANQGYVPDPFTVADYRAATAGLNITGGAVVAGSFQGGSDPSVSAQSATVPVRRGQTPLALGVGWWMRWNGSGPASSVWSSCTAVWATRRSSSSMPRACGRCASTCTVAATLDERLALRVHELAGWHAEVYAGGRELARLEDRLRALPRLSIDHLGLDRDALPVLQRLGAMVKATGFGRVDLDVAATLRAIDPAKLMFGTDLPGTRARRPFEPADLELVAEIAPQALADNARAWYRPRA